MSTPEKRYVRLETVVYVEMEEGEDMYSAEDRFLDALPNGMDCAGYKSSMWAPDDE